MGSFLTTFDVAKAWVEIDWMGIYTSRLAGRQFPGKGTQKKNTIASDIK